MASIRTLVFGDAEFKWNTGRLCDVPYVHDDIKKWYKTYIKPRLHVNDFYEIRKAVFNLVHDAIANGDVKTMADMTNLIMALRLTMIDENNMDENGYFKLMFMVHPERYERITFYNIPWHINHHCKQLYQFCFVQVKRAYTEEEIALSYTTGEWKDRKWNGIDLYSKCKEEERKRRKRR